MSDWEPILLVEDNDDDALLVQRTLTSAGVRNPVHRVTEGDAAIYYLRERLELSLHKPLPTLVLLDLKLNGLSGMEVLEWIRAQPSLADLRVIVLTSHDGLREVNRAYALGAKSFLLKPLEIEDARSFKSFLEAHGIIKQASAA